MVVIVGSVTRPEGSDDYPPAVGTVVEYGYSQPIVDLFNQCKKYGITCLGRLGDIPHLRKHGGHTPYRAGSRRGIIWAGDWDMPDDFETWLVATCKSNYDTSWIRFYNINGRQYDHGGNLLGSSGDHHWHCEVHDGFENKSVTLVDDYMKSKDGPMFTIRQLLDTIIPSSANGSRTIEQCLKDATSASKAATEAKNAAEDAVAIAETSSLKLNELHAKVNDIILAPQPEIDYVRLARAVVDEAISRNGS